MDHQTYRSWILDDEPLDPQDEGGLKEHLLECGECAQLHANLNEALHLVSAAPEIPAPLNFTQRFTASLAERKREEERKQATRLTLALSSSALVIALGALLIAIPDISLISISAGLITAIFTLAEFVQSVSSFITTFYKAANPASLVTVFVVIGGWILIASFTLALSVWKLAVKKVDITK